MNAIDWSAIAVFKDLPPAALDKVKSIFDLRAKNAGETLIEEGQLGDEMYILVSGRARISKAMLVKGMNLPIMDMENPRKVLATLDGSQYPIFGEIALIDQDQRSATVQVLEDSKFLVTDRARFFDLIHREPGIGVPLLLALSRRLATTVRKNNTELVKLTTALALALTKSS